MASRLSPVLIFYQYLLYPVTKPLAIMQNWMVGQESIHYFTEKSLVKLIRRHVDEGDADEIDHVEGVGAINFLTMEDISTDQEGERLHPNSIIPLEHPNKKPIFPEWSSEKENAFLKKINKSGEKWVVLSIAGKISHW